MGPNSALPESCHALWEQSRPVKAGRKEGQRRTLGSARKRKPLSSPLDLRKPPGLASKNRRGGGEGLGTPRAPPAGDPRALSCWEVNTGPRRLPGPSRAGLVTFWASSRAYRPLWRGAQEVACSPAPNPPHQLKEPFVWAVPLPPRPLRGGGGRVWTLPSQGWAAGGHTHIRQGGSGGLGAPCRGREEVIGPGQGAEAAQRGPGAAQGVWPTPARHKPGHSHSPWSHAGPEPQRLKERPWFPACSDHFLMWATWNLRLLIAPYRQGEGAGEFHVG